MENLLQTLNLLEIPNKLVQEVQERMNVASAGHHDFTHVDRVVRTGLLLARAEKADARIVALACLLHDIADHKFHGGDRSLGPRIAGQLMEEHGVDSGTRETVCDIIERVSFSGAGGKKNMDSSIEGQCAQDADRLDAIGAIGIGRAFSYGGSTGRPLQSTLEHFDEKLLQLHGLLNTATAKHIGQKRHAMLEEFKQEFMNEWNSNGTNNT